MFESERRDLAWVPRWTIARCNRRQSVAEHSYYVTAYGLEFARLINWDGDRYRLCIYLLRHDENESFEGDTPGPIKRINGNADPVKIRKMGIQRFGPPVEATEEMQRIKKAADLLDECFYLAGEINSGNRAVLTLLTNSRGRLRNAVLELPAQQTEHNPQLFATLDELIDKEIGQSKNVAGLVEQV